MFNNQETPKLLKPEDVVFSYQPAKIDCSPRLQGEIRFRRAVPLQTNPRYFRSVADGSIETGHLKDAARVIYRDLVQRVYGDVFDIVRTLGRIAQEAPRYRGLAEPPFANAILALEHLRSESALSIALRE
jgi:hypothetical protein